MVRLAASLRQIGARTRRIAVRLGLGGGPSAFTRVVYTVPRQIVFITAQHGGEEALWPVDWHMPVALDPPRYAFSCDAGGHGAGVVLSAGTFVVNFVAADLEREILAAGAMSGRDGNKRERLGLSAAACSFVAAPRLSRADAWLECEVEGTEVWGDRRLVVGRVRHAEVPAVIGRLYHEWQR